MKVINLTRNKITIIDDEDYERVIRLGSWQYTTGGYAVHNTHTGIERRLIVYLLHRFIINAKKGEYIDHINGDKLDNRKSNLRICTQSQNMMNYNIMKNNTSGFRGIHWRKDKRKWRARINYRYQEIYLGDFKDIKDAIRVRKEAEARYYGEYRFIPKEET